MFALQCKEQAVGSAMQQPCGQREDQVPYARRHQSRSIRSR